MTCDLDRARSGVRVNTGKPSVGPGVRNQMSEPQHVQVASRVQREAGPSKQNVTQVDARDRARETGHSGGEERQGAYADLGAAADDRARVELNGWQHHPAVGVAIAFWAETIP